MVQKVFNIKAQFHNQNYEIELTFRDTVALVTGDSALGKSLVYQIIKGEIIDGNINAKCYNYTEISELAEDETRNQFGFTGKLVIIDNADLILSNIPWVADEINLNIHNYYIIFGRSAPGVDISPNTWATLKQEGNKFSLDYKYPEGMWP